MTQHGVSGITTESLLATLSVVSTATAAGMKRCGNPHCQKETPILACGRCDTCYRWFKKHGSDRQEIKPSVSAITAYSAAVMLMQWAADHGRPPLCSECRPAHGLMYWPTYFKVFECQGSGFSAVLEHAARIFAHSNGYPAPCSSGLSALPTSAVKLRTCLGLDCDATFPDEGPHVRFCTQCRKRKIFTDAHGHSTDPWLEPAVTRVQLRRLGFGHGGLEEDVLWGME
jgi:hypothetical protein